MLSKALAPLAAILAQAASSAAADTLYFADFSSGVPAGLTGSTTVVTSPSGQKFVELAPAGGTATLTLDTTGFTDVSLDFTLYTIKSVDGSNTDYGPDPFELKVNGVTVFYETFANFYAWGQSYGGPGSPAGTGSVGVGQLGYPEQFGYDHTYSLTFALGAPGPATVIQFISRATQPNFDEAYGIDNIRVAGTPGPGVPEPGAWALMILGFGAAGAALRTRRRASLA